MSDIMTAIGRLARVMGFMSRDPEDVINEAIRRELNRDGSVSPLPEAKKVGRVIGPALNVEQNERAIARIDRTVVIKKGQRYPNRGHVATATKDISKTTRGYRVQFKHRGRLYCKFFSDSKCSGALGARAAARKWRDAKEREIGRSVVTQRMHVRLFEERR